MNSPKILLLSLLVVAASAAALFARPDEAAAPTPTEAVATPAPGGTFRDFTLEIATVDLDTGAGTWHAWAFDGQVPGPTLEAKVGDVLRVTVVNRHDLVHSFHTHLVPAGLASDGSQLNAITGIGGMAMIPPGGSYTYTLRATVAGLNYYHCHSADGGHTISEHMAQGLYGAILIRDRDAEPIRTEVVMMGERGFDVDDPAAPYFIMNGKGLPGGEHELERIFGEKGVAGVVAELGVTVPVLRGRVGEPVELAIVNIGDAVHTFHLHGMTAYSQEQQPGHVVPAQVVQLAPGAVDRIRFAPTDAGLWLFHCHVVSHADQGMIGVFLVDPAKGALALPEPAARDGGGRHPPRSPAPGNGTARDVEILAGPDGAELSFGPDRVPVEAGPVSIRIVNEGRAVHSLSLPALGASTGPIPPGGSKVLEVVLPLAGSYAFVCAEPGHEGAGMKGTLEAA